MNWYMAVLKKYAVFAGRASRQEYWMFILVNVIIMFALSILAALFGRSVGGMITIILYIYQLAVLIPSLAVAIRRLHDTDRSGWWILIGLVPLVGFIVTLVFMVLPGTPGSNRFGANPKGVVPPTVTPAVS